MSPALTPSAENECKWVWSRDGVALAALAVCTTLIFWKITLTSQFTWADSQDFVHQVIPWLQEQARQWRSGAFPLWDSRHWGGYSFVGQTQPGVLFPVNWLLAWTPLRDGHLTLTSLNWYFAFIHYLGAASGYVLCRHTGCSRAASGLGGIAFGLSGFVGNTAWPQMINGAIFAPVVLLFLFKTAAGRRPVLNAAIGGSLLGASLWSGHHQVPTFILLAAMLLLAYVGGSGMLPWRVVAACAGAFGGMTLLIGAPQLLPGREFYMDALRWVNTQNPVTWKDKVPYSAHMQYSLSPGQMPGFIIPHWQGNVVLYVGVAVFGLAGFAVHCRWNLFTTRCCTLLAVFFLVFSFGTHMPLHGILYVLVPDLDKSRNLAFGVSIVHLALAVLAATGLDAVRSAWRSRHPHVWTFGWIAGALSCLLYAFVVGASLVKADAHVDPLVSNGATAAFAAAGLSALVLGRRSQRLGETFCVYGLVALVLLESGTMTGATFRHREHGWGFLSELSAHNDIAQFLRERLGTDRIARDRRELQYNFGDWHGLDDTDGYISPLASVFRLGTVHDGALLSARYRIAKRPRFEGQQLLFQGQSGFNVYAEPDAFPRAWSVHSTVSLPAGAAMGDFLRRPLAELRQSAAFEGPAPQVEACSEGDAVDIRSMTPTRIRIEATMKCTGAVILSNAYARGWRATVDGRNERIYPAYGFLQGVRVESGRHTIEFRYVPSALYAGLALAGAGLIALLALARLPRHRH
jgi:hypothetical protein